MSEAEGRALDNIDIHTNDAYFQIMDVGDRIVIPYGTANAANTHEDLSELERAANWMASEMTTSDGKQFTG